MVEAAQSEHAARVALLEHLIEFEGQPEEFLIRLLAAQCSFADADGGAVFRSTPQGQPDVIAVHPQPEAGSPSPVWLAVAAEALPNTISSQKTSLIPLRTAEELYGQRPAHHVLLIPIRGRSGVRGAAAFVLATHNRDDIDSRRERLELSIQLLSLYEMRLTLQGRDDDLRQLQVALEMVAAVNRADRFVSAAMSFCNETASRWHAQRASVGFLTGRYVVMHAMSHTEKFDRKMELVQTIESVMEECLDQDIEVVHPPLEDAPCIARAAEHYTGRHGPLTVCSMPIRKDGQVRAVLTLDRPLDESFDAHELNVLRLTCDLCGPRLLELHDNDRWFGARLAKWLRKGIAKAVGPTHTWIKAAALGILAGGLFVTFAQGTYRAEASFEIQPTVRQIVPAPFDGYLETVTAKIGETVEGNQTLLATIDTSELRLQLASYRADEASNLKRAALARRQGEQAEAQVAEAEAAKVRAQIDLVEYKISQADIRPTISGIVVAGDLERQLGAPFATGDILFEVAPLDALRAELAIPEDQIADVQTGQTGLLATASFPGDKIPFVVERINPMAEIVEGRNVFRVFARLQETRAWLRPGMAGVAKIDIDQRSYAWIWTRELVNWVRMKLWI